MTQHELDTEVANATGESITTVSSMGFSVLQPCLPDADQTDIAAGVTPDISAA